MQRVGIAAAACLLLLAGCSSDAKKRVMVARPPSDSVSGIQLQHAGPPPPVVRLPVPTRKPLLMGKSIDTDPDRLIGLDTSATTELLGEPALRDEKPPARVWTYNAKDCVLNIFFYADINTRVFHALTYEIKNDDPSDAGRRHCMGELVRHNES